MDINIKINSLAKEEFDFLKKENSFKTFSDCIIGISNFFKEHHVSPRDKLSNSFVSSILESKIELKKELEGLKKFIREDSQSLRKRHGAIEKSYLLPIEKKVSDIHDYITKKSIEKRNYELENKVIIPEKKEDLTAIKKLEFRIKELEYLALEKDKKINKLKEVLGGIKEKISVEKSIIGKEKLYIEMSKEDFELLLKN